MNAPILESSGISKQLVRESDSRINEINEINKITLFIHKHFLVLLLIAYILSATLPAVGLWLRTIQLTEVHLSDGSTVKVTMSLFMLSLLLFNAGLGIKLKDVFGILKRPSTLFWGLLANIAIPILLVVLLRGAMQFWHSSEELQNLLVGLGLVIAMPIAGASTAWAQNANGNLSLSLGLIFLSAVLSPITTPIVLHLFGLLTAGHYSKDLHQLAAQGMSTFLLLTVVAPALMGIAANLLLGEKHTTAIKPFLKLANFVVILVLSYSNGATSLPTLFAKNDLDSLGLVIITTVCLCAVAFGAGWLLSRCLRTGKPDQASLMFGLGMNSNGMGLVLAATALSDHPAVMLPLIFYSVVQQIMAALVDRRMFQPESVKSAGNKKVKPGLRN